MMMFVSHLFSRESTTNAQGTIIRPPVDLHPVADLDDSRRVLIDQIVQINPSAGPAFLRQFAEPQLRKYLDHLEAGTGPRGRNARWVRCNDVPALCGIVNED